MKPFIVLIISFCGCAGGYSQSADDYYNSGVSKGYLENYRGAIQDYNKAIELNPKNEIFYTNRGSAKDKLEDYRGAIEDFNKAIELNPYYAMAFYNRGVSKYNLEDLNGACLDWSKAGELGLAEAYATIRQACN